MNIKPILLFLILLAMFMSTASADYIWIPYDESDPLPNLGGSTQYNAAPTVFNYNGTLRLITGIQWGNFGGYRWTGSSWEAYPAATTGLPSDIGWRSRPTVFYRDDTWWLISGERYGGWYGYKWGGSSWSANSSVISGIYQSIFYEETSATVFNDSGTWKLISGNEHCIWKGHYWNGASWTQDPSVVTGLNDIGEDNTPKAFYQDGTWKLICGASNGRFYGWYWSGSTWVSDSSIVNGLTDVGSNSKPAIFDKDGTLNLMSGCGIDTFYGWTQQEVFSLSGTVTNASGPVNNTAITLSGAGGSTTSNETGYYEITTIYPSSYTISAIETLHYDYSSSISITDDTEKNIFLTLLPIGPEPPVIAIPPVVPTQVPTPMLFEENELTIFEESIEKLTDLSILIINSMSKALSWTFLLAAYIGAITSHVLIKGKEDEEVDVFNVLLFGTIGWVVPLFINFTGLLTLVTESFWLNALISGIAGFAVYTILNIVSSKE